MFYHDLVAVQSLDPACHCFPTFDVRIFSPADHVVHANEKNVSPFLEFVYIVSVVPSMCSRLIRSQWITLVPHHQMSKHGMLHCLVLSMDFS